MRRRSSSKAALVSSALIACLSGVSSGVVWSEGGKDGAESAQAMLQVLDAGGKGQARVTGTGGAEFCSVAYGQPGLG
jgi:hypothetical protein